MNSLLTDPANHPANGQLSVQRIERVIEALESSLKYRNGSSMDNVLADAVKGLRELRESREAKGVPVADVVAWHKEGEERICDIRWRRFDVAPGPLFTTPPVPVEMNSDRAWGELKISAEDCQAWAEGWNACRAAMLKHPASIHTSTDADCSTEIKQPSSNSFANAELEMMAHGNNPQANAYRELLARRNSPVTPDGWIPVSEWMPDPKSELRVCVYTPSPHEDLRYRCIAASLFKAVCRDATHWHYMTEPAAPKEVG